MEVWNECLGAGPAPEPCRSLIHHTYSLITEQQAAAGQAVGVKKNDKLQHLETILPHAGAFVAQVCLLALLVLQLWVKLDFLHEATSFSVYLLNAHYSCRR